uniref:Ubiquitin-like protease family profile domain-containing protein n=1 Tax=Brassica oleracea var. oleracea TaxID=109376 RepID=A0A0D3E938_BRAOL
MDSADSDMELSDMMFADSEEPDGIQYLRLTPFGKIVEIAEKPAFSGRFVRFLLSRQLKVEKIHEAWFRFAGKPIRFSLREFSIVTGLPCGEIPAKSKVKKKRTLKDKPYWAEMFGTVEDLSVSRAVKMLRKNSVTDKDMRQKLACLAILAIELLGDLEDFFAFPWGRLAFDMLMISIKNRDEVSLSQDTIALKGFALALQLVIVEAVPSLTEVVQEACSSSDSDSEDEEIEGMIYKPKKQTLDPAHAREVDKKCEVRNGVKQHVVHVLVRSIIPDDPARPVDESVLKWADEVYDVKVENLLKLISLNHVFRGGATKLDVQRMREKPKAPGRKKRAIQKDKSSTAVDESRIIAIVSGLLKPEIERVDGHVASALSSVRDVSSAALSYQASVVSSVEAMLKAFKKDILTSVGNANGKGGPDANDAIIVNVLDNISHCSTPPGSADRSALYEGRSRYVRGELTSCPRMDNENHGVTAFSANSKTNEQIEPAGTPSFSLGFTQDQPPPAPVVDDEMGDNGDGDRCEPVVDTKPRRTSKRLRLVPPPLITDYQCETAILNRARESKLVGSNYYELPVIRGKFAKLSSIVKKPWTLLILQKGLDLCRPRSYERFRKSKTKASYVFLKGLVDCAVKSCSSGNASTRFYLPLHVQKKHWIGLCVDFTDAKIYVFDCNQAVRSDSELTQDLLPISDMFPYLLKFSGLLAVSGNKPLCAERIKGVALNNNSPDAALTAALLIQTHALFGVEICSYY